MSLRDALLQAFMRWLDEVLGTFAAPQPAPFTFRIERIDMAQFNVFAVLPTVPAGSNVASQELTLTTNGTKGIPQTVAADATEQPLGTFNDGDQLSADLVYLDAQGNRSQPRTETTTVTAPSGGGGTGTGGTVPQPDHFSFRVEPVAGTGQTSPPPTPAPGSANSQ